MNRGTFFTLALNLLLATGPMLIGQDAHRASRQSPEDPSNILGPELVAWSEVQKPQPVQRSVPSADQPPSQPNPQAAQGSDYREEQSSGSKPVAARDPRNTNK